ncbi:MAG: carboxypeptidase M32 [Chloroflexi bacterium]|nr:carboxypeptidase M32 [Chloroflexota bacterium]
MNENFTKLKTLIAEVADLNAAQAILGWDQQTYMPPGGAEARGHQLATLGSLTHQKFTSEEIGKLLDELKREFADADPDSDEARYIKVAAKDYDQATKVPSEYVARFAQLTARAHESWAKAREASDFSIFQADLEEIVEIRKEYVSFFPPADHPYDTLLDEFEPGMKTAEVQEIFGTMRVKQVELLKAIADAKQVDDSFMHVNYPEKQQWDFGVEVATKFGYDWNRGRQDKSVHPFTTSFGINDVRITTRFMEDFFPSALFGTMHEAGHGLYEMGVNQEYERTPLNGGASLGLHESQSRMYENLVGRSMPFWEHFYPRLQETFPTQLGNVDLPNFYKGINKVEPSLIRVEADEATYNMHIMLRLELEIAMIEGSVAVKDLPELWNTKFEEYLGITPPNDAEGVLQDIHWSFGGLGYFSTYALGNLVSVQLWEKINEDISDLDEQIRQGKFDTLLSWLRDNVHTHGRKYEPQELVQKVTGSKITPEPYLRYLESKYSDIYGL